MLFRSIIQTVALMGAVDQPLVLRAPMAHVSIERKYMETVRFDQLDLYPQVLRAIAEMGFEEATPIQSQAIPVVMSGVDVIGQAQTGTGKTASFGIPVLHKVDPNNKKTQVIILSPTRELAIQVADEIRKLAKYMHGVKILPVYGGQEISRQIKALKGGDRCTGDIMKQRIS